jgi:hypothetical protein
MADTQNHRIFRAGSKTRAKYGKRNACRDCKELTSKEF